MSKNLLLLLALAIVVGLTTLFFLRERDACQRPGLAAGVAPLDLQLGESPLFCNAKALTAYERKHHTALTQKLFAAVSAKRELPDGISFSLNPSEVTLLDLADWVSAEKKCCPFLDFRISLARENGPMELALTGRTGVKSLLLELIKQTTSVSAEPGK